MQSNNITNQSNCNKIPRVVKPTKTNCYYKTFGSDEITANVTSLPSYMINTRDNRNNHFRDSSLQTQNIISLYYGFIICCSVLTNKEN